MYIVSYGFDLMAIEKLGGSAFYGYLTVFSTFQLILHMANHFINKQGRIVHRSGLKMKNNRN